MCLTPHPRRTQAGQQGMTAQNKASVGLMPALEHRTHLTSLLALVHRQLTRPNITYISRASRTQYATVSSSALPNKACIRHASCHSLDFRTHVALGVPRLEQLCLMRWLCLLLQKDVCVCVCRMCTRVMTGDYVGTVRKQRLSAFPANMFGFPPVCVQQASSRILRTIKRQTAKLLDNDE